MSRLERLCGAAAADWIRIAPSCRGFERIEGTVDLMPNDLIYHAYIDAEGRPRVEPGPLLHHGADLAVFFFNEINRARPQVQSLLLRVMAERSVRAFNRDSALPFVTVFADRNRVEREETFELAVAARDRFMIEVSVDAPVDDDLRWRLISEPQFHDPNQLLEQVPRGAFNFRALRESAQITDGASASAGLGVLRDAYVALLPPRARVIARRWRPESWWAGVLTNAVFELVLLMFLLGVPFCIYFFRLRTGRTSVRDLLIDCAAAVTLYLTALFLL